MIFVSLHAMAWNKPVMTVMAYGEGLISEGLAAGTSPVAKNGCSVGASPVVLLFFPSSSSGLESAAYSTTLPQTHTSPTPLP